jgi:hypothetical protein
MDASLTPILTVLELYVGLAEAFSGRGGGK